jgi:hypothetical protein
MFDCHTPVAVDCPPSHSAAIAKGQLVSRDAQTLDNNPCISTACQATVETAEAETWTTAATIDEKPVNLGENLNQFLQRWEPIFSRLLLKQLSKSSHYEIYTVSNDIAKGDSVRFQLLPWQHPGVLWSSVDSQNDSSKSQKKPRKRQRWPVCMDWSGLRLSGRLLIGYGCHPMISSQNSFKKQDEFLSNNSGEDDLNWCTHRGYLCMWNLNMPKQRVQTDRCDRLLECQVFTIVLIHLLIYSIFMDQKM